MLYELTKNQDVIDRLANRSSVERRRASVLRSTQAYKHQSEIATFAQTNPTPAQIIRFIHDHMNRVSGYGYARVAATNKEAMELVIKERKL